MHRPARCRDREWTGGVDDPQPDRHTGKIAIRSVIPPLRDRKFADSLLEGRVTSELVSEIG